MPWLPQPCCPAISGFIFIPEIEKPCHLFLHCMAQCKIGMVIKYLLQEDASLSERLTYTGGIPASSPGCPADRPDSLQHLLQCGRITFDERLMEPYRDLTGACLRLRLSQTYEACRLSSTLDLGLHPFLVHPVGELFSFRPFSLANSAMLIS